MAEQALRVLGFAFREDIDPSYDEENTETDMTFIGLAGMIDPPREEVEEALEKCRRAGVNVKMVTGDNAKTAKAIAQDISLTQNPQVLTGKEIQGISDSELDRKISEIDIFARTHPEDKLRIVEQLQDDGEVVAMTGDGVNDAPAVKKADVGISMGQKGTDVTKEASDVILEDDNFATIVSAVKDGRRIFDNIEKFTTYLVSINFTELVVLALGLAVFGFEYLPLIAVQILFLNVIEEEIPAISLGMDPGDKKIMERPPRNPSAGIMHKRNLFLVVSMAAITGLTSFAVFALTDPVQQLEVARTATFVTISMVMASALFFRSLDHSALEVGILENKWLIGSIMLIAPITAALVYLPAVADLFSHQPLKLKHWIYIFAASLAPIAGLEMLKQIANKFIDKSYMYKQMSENV
jgi:Ca2+-transporting ATPase